MISTLCTMSRPSIDDAKKDENNCIPVEEEGCSSVSSSVSTTSSSSSVNTDEALLDMLGIDCDDYTFAATAADDDDDDEDDDRREIRDAVEGQGVQVEVETAGGGDLPQHHISNNSKPESKLPENIKIPSRCSRYFHRPSQCCAFTVSSVLSRAECRYLIQRAASAGPAAGSSSSSSNNNTGFQYVTEASHIDENGNSIMVKLQNPNPHKLALFRDDEFVNKVLWERLRPFVAATTRTAGCGGSGDDANSSGNNGDDWKDSHHRQHHHINNFYKRSRCGKPLGLNPRVRILRYDATDQDRFEPHFDATTTVGNRTSLLTVLIYLNDGNGVDFDGGETWYLDSHVSNLNTALKVHDVDDEEGESSRITTRVTPRAGDVVIFEHDLYHSGAPLAWGTKYVMRTDVMFNGREVGVDSAAGCRRRGMDGEDKTLDNDTCSMVADDKIACDDTACVLNSISDFADTICLTDAEKEYLLDIGLLHVTPETFLAPGEATMRLMLRDGVEEDRICALLDLAVEATRTK
mmetsp:Transcript_5348/g.10230  ORF Transcript_5348/g.10230 Transcript_5348/m.10230 type:complete len:520 (-) Transcript_5348:65-1624(-)